jgi:hypothetical protein
VVEDLLVVRVLEEGGRRVEKRTVAVDSPVKAAAPNQDKRKRACGLGFGRFRADCITAHSRNLNQR